MLVIVGSDGTRMRGEFVRRFVALRGWQSLVVRVLVGLVHAQSAGVRMLFAWQSDVVRLLIAAQAAIDESQRKSIG